MTRTIDPSRPHKLLHCLLVALVIAAALLMRIWNLNGRWMMRDEAESSINALTILQHGIPTGQYMGMPIYENTLVKPWPQSAEYEFKDSSYSEKNIAIYHGWLPLYAMALSFKAHGTSPDAATDPPRVLHTEKQMRIRAGAARIPSVLFAIIFLVAVYLAGRIMAGPNAGLIALIIAAFLPACVEYARQARYYSAAVAFGTLSFIALWQVVRRGSWGDYLLWGASLLLLFFTYAVTFGTGVAGWVLIAPWSLRKPGAIAKSVLIAAIVAITIIPWLVLTGALGNHTGIPPARSVLAFPGDYLAYLREHAPLVMGLVLLVIAMLFVQIEIPRLPQRVTYRLRAILPASAFALGWVVLGYLTFVLVIPSSSMFMGRVKLGTIGPACVLAGILADGIAQSISQRCSRWVPIVFLLVMAGASFKADWQMIRPLVWREPGFQFVADFRKEKLDRGTRIYAAPIDNLALMYGAGLPVQNVAPVRKSFLDSYPGRILIIDSAPKSASPNRSVGNDGLWQNPAMFRGYESFDMNDFWINFFYRFVGPASRSGSNANCAGRIAHAKVIVTRSGWVIYDCPAR